MTVAAATSMQRGSTRKLGPAAKVDPMHSARSVGLRYVDDRGPGIRRRKRGRGFVFVDDASRPVRDARTHARIQKLAVPPAWTDVWICPDPDGHIQATGRDARGRKQYRYHTRFRDARDETKYEKLLDFANVLPKIRARCERDLSRPGLSREKVLAAVVRLLEMTFIRVGNEEYTRLNQSFGLTTLRDKHAKIRGTAIEFHFRGKSGKDRAVRVCDKRLATIVKRCQDLPGEVLFQYVDGAGEIRSIGSSDVNEYLRETTGEDITAKDFRTWAGTLLAALSLSARGPAGSHTAAKKVLVEAVREASEQLGNTPSVCRKCYIHPAVLEAYLRGHVLPQLSLASEREAKHALRPEEKAVVAFLRRASAMRAAEQGPKGLETTLRRSLQRSRSARRARPAALMRHATSSRHERRR